jgi:S-adenosylmethionine:tRNA ribosyltransferase-isomerase
MCLAIITFRSRETRFFSDSKKSSFCHCQSAHFFREFPQMHTKDFDYRLPRELIAQQPAAERTQARLMFVDRATGALGHYRVADLPDLLKPGDLMVLNDTRVIPARVFGRKQKSSGRVEALFIEETEKNVWQVFLHASRRPRPGETILLAGDRISGQVLALGERGRAVLKVDCADDLQAILAETGVPPLPPYIKRPKSRGLPGGGPVAPRAGISACNPVAPERAGHPMPGQLRNEQSMADYRNQSQSDKERYQTVYARMPGAIAAPTAGLHFSGNLLAKLAENGVQKTFVTLHVGPGTFIPVRCEQIAEHKMESERYIVEPAAAQKINRAIAEKRRIVAVGTTVVRVLESVTEENGLAAAGSGRTEIFIHPPYGFKVVGALLTNFHLPCSTLLKLVSAFGGLDLIRRAYETAVREKYRFYSYGDCMLIV